MTIACCMRSLLRLGNFKNRDRELTWFSRLLLNCFWVFYFRKGCSTRRYRRNYLKGFQAFLLAGSYHLQVTYSLLVRNQIHLKYLALDLRWLGLVLSLQWNLRSMELSQTFCSCSSHHQSISHLSLSIRQEGNQLNTLLFPPFKYYWT